MLLEETGFEMLEAGSACEALAVLKQRADDIAVIFTDVRMPGPLDGVTLAQVVGLSWPWIRVVVTSGDRFPSAEDLPETAQFIAKPWRPLDVINLVGQPGNA